MMKVAKRIFEREDVQIRPAGLLLGETPLPLRYADLRIAE